MIDDRLLVTDSSEAQTEALSTFWQTLRENNFTFNYYGQTPELSDYFESQKQGVHAFHWPKYPKNASGHVFYWLAWPFWFLKVFLQMHDRKPQSVVTTGLSDTLLMGALSRLMKFKHYWLLLPELQTRAYKFKFSKKLLKDTQICVYSSLAKNHLEQLGFKNKIAILLPGFANHTSKHQENIFNSLAHKDCPQRKFFTIGTFAELTAESHLETLLKAAKEIRDVVPNLQVIIVGDGPEKKNLLWLAKKLGIESTVWFVGATEKTFKWLENLDLYIYTKPSISLKEQLFALEIMSRKLPLIADLGIGLDDLIFEGKTGHLVIFKNTSDLAQTIIDLEQNHKLREQMGEEAKKRVQELFNPQKTLDQFAKLL